MPSSSELTEMQEKTSAWIFDQALNHNVQYKSPDEILSDKNFKEKIIGTPSKKGIYPYVTKEWIVSFYKQQQGFLKEFSNAKFKEFSVKGGFMDFVSKLVTQKYGIGKKDAWDPADVWCVQNEQQVIKTIKDAVENTGDIEVLNATLRTLFKERKVVGISLKLVDKRVDKARYQEVNIQEGVLFTSGKHPTFTITNIRCDFLLRDDNTFKAANATITFLVKYTKETINYTLTIRTSGRTYKPGNLIFEFQEPGGSAQIGKAPVELVYEAAKRNKMNFENVWQNYPSTTPMFVEKENEYKKMFDVVNKYVETNIKNSDEFSINILKQIADDDNYGTANSKLMQLKFLYEMTKLSEKKMEKFITDLFFLAEKRGPGFGPFGKLY
tara:strand:- start:48 stop:1193 length:1146 start_codon:yes stop_codon:yes gene_type:complete